MTGPDEIAVVAERFGAPEPQVVRDHLISHVLAALAGLPDEIAGPTMFFGGTALCRTWCPDIRLSEDIDLLVASPADIGPLMAGNPQVPGSSPGRRPTKQWPERNS